MKSSDMLPSEYPRKLVQKTDATTNPAYGCSPIERPVKEYLEMGVVNLDKPRGPTSHEVTAWVKDILGLNRAGHSGSLDPGVTGVQPIMLGKATKAVSALRLSGKEYICLMRLHEPVSERRVRSICKQFTGPIFQMPPVISAVKREVRVRMIYYLEVIEVKDKSVLMRVGCEAGTYLRKICHDIGTALGSGAHMQQLRRTKTGPFREDSLVTLHQLKDACVFWEEEEDESYLRKYIKPMEEGLSHLPKIVIRDSAVDAVCQGAAFAVPGIAALDCEIQKDDQVCLFSLKGEVVALCRSQMSAEEMLNSEHGIAARTERIIMDAGTYPQGWHSKPK
ncbi:RNA-guided pseudouridylation complex pseudouridine synthase subunit Cbf5 [Methanolobus halotolerans]|uniref:Probable tRNA pseudouridine synthase B n=1 Tax=Methanolobus halotolerans TaxID=2052935 RepID=A0A4E0PW18_9EURY|nr:RNA-guided pseudouridylation complex pseudouridine synthase subunit Cbf5 [Methanolobus halotolerans]TGC08483.1 RNA-guided pseudouridylation complex pseudouridine synthase subunit Cbf5 [Methanolobus halotolerans]